MSVAGPSAAYEYFARSASGKVAAVRATSPAPADVVIAILSSDGDGTPSAELIATVQAAVNDEDTRPLGDRVTVRGAEIIEYAIDATLYLYPGPESEPIINAATASLRTFLTSADKNWPGRSALRYFGGSACSGVQRVVINSPAIDLQIDNTQVARNTGYSVENGGTDE